MRAARWYGARDVRVDDVDPPVPAPGQVLVRVERVGICGTDLEEYLAGPVNIPVGTAHPRSGRRAPLTLGHEAVGVVAECPGGELPVGVRVVPDVVVGCGRCWWCRRHQEGLCPELVVLGQHDDGALADYLLADASTCVVVSDHVEPQVAAFAEPTSVAVRALRKVGDLTGASVCVIGAGVIGQLVAQVALAWGANMVVAVEPVAARREPARQAGAAAAVHPGNACATVRQLTDGRGADVVVECSGVPDMVAVSVEASRPGGSVVLVGLRANPVEIPLLPMVLGERRMFGSAAHLWDEDVATAVALLARGVVDPLPLLSDVIPLADIVTRGLQRLADDREVLKILVDPQLGR